MFITSHSSISAVFCKCTSTIRSRQVRPSSPCLMRFTKQTPGSWTLEGTFERASCVQECRGLGCGDVEGAPESAVRTLVTRRSMTSLRRGRNLQVTFKGDRADLQTIVADFQRSEDKHHSQCTDQNARILGTPSAVSY